MFRPIQGIFILFFFALMFAGLYISIEAIKDVRFLKTAIPTEASFIGYREDDDFEGYIFAGFFFTTHQHEEITADVRFLPDYLPHFTPNQRVKIYYNPDDPYVIHYAGPNSVAPKDQLKAALIFFAFSIFTISLFLHRIFRKKARRKARKTQQMSQGNITPQQIKEDERHPSSY